MIPTITGLNKGKNPIANDISDSKAAIDEVMSVSKTAANDIVDSVAKTMDRIIQRHNGHNNRYRDSRGRYTTRQKAAANDKTDAVGNTMDRIMSRHNGHDNAPGRFDAANENRIIHDYNGIVPQANKSAQIVPETSSPIPSNNNGGSSPEDIVPILRSIDSNTENSKDLLKLIRQDINDLTIDLEKARERDLIKDKGYIAGTKESISSMDQEGKEKGKEKEKPGFLKSIMSAGTGIVATAVTGAVGAATSYFVPQTQADNKGGGFDGSSQTAREKASSHGPAPVLPSGKGNVTQNKAALVKALRAKGFNDREIAQIMAQAEAESGFKPRSENLNYSASTLNRLFGKKVHASGMTAQQIVARGPEAIGNLIYGGRMGNSKNEGYKYRGRGLIQLTGKDQYAYYSKKLGIDLVNNPDLANDPAVAAAIASQYYADRKNKFHLNLETASGATRATAPKDLAGETRKRAMLAEKYNSATINALASVQPTGGSNNRGKALNQQSAQQNSKPKIVVVNAPTNNVVSGGKSQHPTKPRVPPAKSESWAETAKHYFGF